jgi:hypothetical protein
MFFKMTPGHDEASFFCVILPEGENGFKTGQVVSHPQNQGVSREGPQNFGRETDTVNSSRLGLQPNLPQGRDDVM